MENTKSMGPEVQLTNEFSSLEVIEALERQFNEQRQRELASVNEKYDKRIAELKRLRDAAQGDKRVYSLLGPKEAIMYYLETHGGTAKLAEVVDEVMRLSPGKFSGQRDAIHSARIMVAGNKDEFRYNPKTDIVSLSEKAAKR